MAEDNSRRHSPAKRWFFLVLAAVSATLVLVATLVVPLWARVLIPNWLIKNASFALLWSLLVVYAVVAPAILVAGGCAVFGAIVMYYRRERRALEGAMRWALLGSICLIGLIVSELVSGHVIRGGQRLAVLPTDFEQQRSRRSSDFGPSRAKPKAEYQASARQGNPSDQDE
ncbi:MAG TPA: hypothetical protein VHS97_22705, partial [Isosphaeraceae bacterium]|nr:hypothetical protein [Isosphaeraceae bacterium]